MKVNFKTLKQKTFQIDVEESMTVSQLKSELKNVPGVDGQEDQMKLIFRGKILKDETVGSLGLTEKDFIVVMVATSKASSSSTPAAAPKPAAPSVPVSAPATAPAPSQPQPQAVVDTRAGVDTQENLLATGSSLEIAISNLVDMGFPRDQVIVAMRAAFNNPDRAAEYLMTVFLSNVGYSRGDFGTFRSYFFSTSTGSTI
jgi:UV excision repair protein RAD23